MKRWLLPILLLFVSMPLAAQPLPVAQWPDWASYGTALVNPAMGAIAAARSSDAKCQLGRLALSEAIGNGAALTLKHFIVSPRPCLGCAADGFPSGHTMNSVIGMSSNWKLGLAFTLGTAELRTDAHRHTPLQVGAGALLGFAAEYLGQKAFACKGNP